MTELTIAVVDAAVLRVMSFMNPDTFKWTRTEAGSSVLYQFWNGDGVGLATFLISDLGNGVIQRGLNGTFQDNYKFRDAILYMIETEIETIRGLGHETATVVQSVKEARKRGPNTETLGKLEELRKLRGENIKKFGGVTLAFTKACGRAGIDPETVKKNDPDLVKYWSNLEY